MNPIFKFALREDLKEEKIFLPKQADTKASGWDVRAAMPDRRPLIIYPFELVKIPLGFRGFLPEGWWYELKPRSSSFAKKNLHALYGTIDETYEGELIFACQYIPPVTEYINGGSLDWKDYLNDGLAIDFGEPIGQIIPVKRQEFTVEEITNEKFLELTKNRAASRGSGGFGSTGIK